MRVLGTCITVCLLLTAACERQRTSSYSRPGDDPHDTDSLYVLYRRILTDSDPVPTWAQAECALARLTNKLGINEATRRLRALRDTVYTPAETERWRAVDRKLWYHSFPLDDATCGPGLEFHYQPTPTSDTSRTPR